jgi:hypothetical protein
VQFGASRWHSSRAGLDREVDVVVTQPIIDEALRVLNEKFRWSMAIAEIDHPDSACSTDWPQRQVL